MDGCANGEDAAYYLEHTAYDLAILDIMMPGKDGLTILRELRRRGSSLPVLLLTALDAIGDRVEGLDAGADDYLTKPFAFDELLARVRMLLRRHSGQKTDQLTVGDLSMTLSTDGQPGRPGDLPLCQGVCGVGVPDAQPGGGAHPQPAGEPCLGL